MKYLPIDSQLFINNRERFVSKTKRNCLAVFNSNDIYNTGADSTLPFTQHRDIFHLSGVDQEESILVIFPDCKNKLHREILFLKEPSEHIAVWEGEKLTKKRAFLAFIFCFFIFFISFLFPLSQMLYWTIKFPENLFDLNVLNLLLNTLYLVIISSIVLITFSLISNYGNRVLKNKFLKRVTENARKAVRDKLIQRM